MKKPQRHIKSSVIVILAMIFILGLLLGRIVKKSFNSENAKFEEFSNQLFVQQLSGNTLNLHYTLANPSDYGINDYAISLGNIDADKISEHYSTLENCRSVMSTIKYSDLKQENQISYDILDLYFETELSLGHNYLLQEMLSPSLGIQAQLPVLLAEYTFRTEQDIKDYLGLLESTDTYFNQILTFQKEKSARGLFMSDATVDRIATQCNAFIANPEANYLASIFEEHLENFPKLDDATKKAYIEQSSAAMKNHVIPAYQNLVNGLQQLKGTGKNINGLRYLDGGKEYYEYLLQSNCGVYDSVEQLQTRLYNQLIADYSAIKGLLTKDPTLATSSLQKNILEGSPENMLEELETKIAEDFPPLNKVSYDVKYVHKDLEKFLSPAFYLTPPIDTLSPNSIYINGNSNMEGVDLYTTLAHEGFPGHLYQTIYFSSQNPLPLRSLLNMGGYIEGWAFYVESYAYGYADTDPNISQLLWHNRSMNLCLYSLLDIAIHYHGWTVENTAAYLKNFGITDQAVIQDVFQGIVEDPGNYLKYSLGYLNFIDLRDEVKEEQGKKFELKQFHQDILELGPVQFPILEKYLLKAS